MPVRKALTPRQKMLKSVIRQAQQTAYRQGYDAAKAEAVPWFYSFFLGLIAGVAVSVGLFK